MTTIQTPAPDVFAAGVGVVDTRGRPLRDLRISVTDRCNFRCTYCMPRDVFGPDHAFLHRSDLLNVEEIGRLARAFVRQGVRKLRLTGGEPLLRPDLVAIVEQLRALGPDLDIALTTNGSLLPKLATPLAEAGLNRVTVSLDSLDDNILRAMTDSRFSVADVLTGIESATEAGLGPVKINTVVRRGMNDGVALRNLLDLANHFRFTGHTIRFIEYMDVGTTNGWNLDAVIPAAEIVEALHVRFGVEPIRSSYAGEVASRYRYLDGGGEVGIITSISNPFCGDCTRARLAADGQLYSCLFASKGTDLRSALRAGADDAQLSEMLRDWWAGRNDRFSELRGRITSNSSRIEMSYVGG